MFDLNKQLEERIILTEEILDFSKGKKSVLLELPTGVGKNYNSFKLLELWEQEKGRELKNILVSVPEIALIDNYKKDAIKLGFERFVDRMEIICHASLHTMEGEHFDAVVIDECHWVISEKRVSSLKNISYDNKVLLSATIDFEELDQIRMYTNFSRYVLDLVDAIDRGILPTPKIVVLSRELDESKFDIEYTDRFKVKRRVSERAAYNLISNDISYYHTELQVFPKNKHYKNRMLQLGSQRKRLLATSKTKLAKKLLEALPETNKAIIFAGSVAQATELGGKGKTCSSQRSKKLNRETIEKFNNGEINRIFVKSMLREGMNLVDTKYGIDIQIGGRERETLQKLGRVLRHPDPIYYVLVSPNTTDDRLIDNLPGKYIVKFMKF